MKDKLLEAQDRQKDNTDKSRKVHPMINIGDKIWLLHCNLKTNCPSNKLDFCSLGPFPVIKKINDLIFRQELIPSIKIHHVFMSLYSSSIRNHLYQVDFKYHLFQLGFKEKKN